LVEGAAQRMLELTLSELRKEAPQAPGNQTQKARPCAHEPCYRNTVLASRGRCTDSARDQQRHRVAPAQRRAERSVAFEASGHRLTHGAPGMAEALTFTPVA